MRVSFGQATTHVHGDTPLHTAARRGDTVEIALRYNEIPFDTKNEREQTALDVAIEACQARAVITLLTVPELINKTPLWASLNRIGEYFFSQGHFEEALMLHLKAYDVVELIKENAPHLVTTVQNLAFCYFTLKDYSNACIYFFQEMAHETDPLKKGKILLDIGPCYFNQGLFKKALSTYEEAHNIVVPFFKNNPTETAIALNGMGSCQSRLGNYVEALEHHLEAYNLMFILSEQHHECMIESLDEIAMCYKNLGNIDEAEKHWGQAYLLAKSMHGENHEITLKYKKAQ